MTSSLVGSEMCIRDRERHPNQPPLERGGSQHPGWAGRLAKAQGQERWQAVSYTHLTLPTICSV
eukprot:8939661-Prorocentrum_lima.AAC.1